MQSFQTPFKNFVFTSLIAPAAAQVFGSIVTPLKGETMYPKHVIFNIPADIMKGLATGELIRYGGVVRNQAGEIVEHLVEVAPSLKDALQLVGEKALAVAAANKVKCAAGAAVIVVGVGAGIVVHKRCAKKRQAKQIALAEELQTALGSYFDAVAAGTLTEEIVGNTIAAISNMRGSLKGKKSDVLMSHQLLNTIAFTIRDHTKRLCEAKACKFLEVKPAENEAQASTLETMEAYLGLQRNLLKEAA